MKYTFRCLNTPIGMLYILFADGIIEKTILQNSELLGRYHLTDENEVDMPPELQHPGRRDITWQYLRGALKSYSQFERDVLSSVLSIPSGMTKTYSQIASYTGKPAAVRYVARIIAANPFPIIIPCHRVVRKDGSLGGYVWGVENKKKLLAYEKLHTLTLF